MNPRVAIHGFVFLGAVLLLSLEPLVGRLLLPRFGGAFHVWTTALMFFQGALFAGYLYAHVFAARLGRWHLALVAVPLLVLPPSVGDSEAGVASVDGILALLVRHIALPFGVLATTAVVAQRWWASTGREPYGLYAVSNAGSLGALLVYALVIEPFVGLHAQRWAWMSLYVLYAIFAALAWYAKSAPRHHAPRALEGPRTPTPPLAKLAYWALLSAAPSAFLMAVTNLVALEAGSIPLVWIVPLAIYLGSFVVAFARPRESDAEGTRVPATVRRLWPHVAAVGVFFFSGGDAGGGWIDVAVQLTVLAFVCLAAHAELHRARPEPEHLTRYYLVVALGGWVGGAFVALLAPIAFTGLLEYPIALAVLALTVAIGRRDALKAWLKSALSSPARNSVPLARADSTSAPLRSGLRSDVPEVARAAVASRRPARIELPVRRTRAALLVSAALVIVIVLKIGHASLTREDTSSTLDARRSFYGLYRVTRTERHDGAVRDLVSGNTRHGRQREGDRTPLSYYHPEGPLGDALAIVERPRRVGVVGLGVGAAAGHLERGEHVRFFEIDPVVAELADAHFTYLSGAAAAVDVVVGDARVSLEREAIAHAQGYDLLLVDAFAGDAIPTHLLTLEALRLYLSRLTPDGVLLLHVSNRYYDLRGVLGANAQRLELGAVEVARVDGLARDEDPARYVAMARAPERLAPLVARGWHSLVVRPNAVPWTDDHVNVLGTLISGP